jgi:undecaprenyl-diphosphatase
MIAMCGFKAGWPFIIISFLVGYSRIYVGVHFPLDVAVGWLIGSIFALAVCRFIRDKWPETPAVTDESQLPPVPS